MAFARRPFGETGDFDSLDADAYFCVVSVCRDFSGVALRGWTLGFVQRPFVETLICWFSSCGRWDLSSDHTRRVPTRDSPYAVAYFYAASVCGDAWFLVLPMWSLTRAERPHGETFNYQRPSYGHRWPCKKQRSSSAGEVQLTPRLIDGDGRAVGEVQGAQ